MIIRFGIVGLLCTALAYGVFILLAPRMHYQLANLLAWGSSVGLGFILNRFITFRVRTRDNILKHFGLFAVGSLSQLALSSLIYAMLIGGMHLPPPIAFLINTAATATLMFGWLKLVTFR